jgi:plastocyanin
MGDVISTRAGKAIAAAALVLGAAGAVAVAASVANGPAASAVATKTVRVADDFYAPKRLKVAKGTRIKWVWASESANRHNVYLYERPDGSPRFNSQPATAPFSYTRKLRKPGTYKVLCTLHEGMRMRIDVRR